jgi:hypothetical protein
MGPEVIVVFFMGPEVSFRLGPEVIFFYGTGSFRLGPEVIDFLWDRIFPSGPGGNGFFMGPDLSVWARR